MLTTIDFVLERVQTVLSGIETGEGASKDLHKVAVAAKTAVHVSKVGVDVVSIPTYTTQTSEHSVHTLVVIHSTSVSVRTPRCYNTHTLFLATNEQRNGGKKASSTQACSPFPLNPCTGALYVIAGIGEIYAKYHN